MPPSLINTQSLISTISLLVYMAKLYFPKSILCEHTTKYPWLRKMFVKLPSPPHLVCSSLTRCLLVSATQHKLFNVSCTKLLVVSILFLSTSMTFLSLAQMPSNTKSIYDYFSIVFASMVTWQHPCLVFHLSNSWGIKSVRMVFIPLTQKFKPSVISLFLLHSPSTVNSLAW